MWHIVGVSLSTHTLHPSAQHVHVSIRDIVHASAEAEHVKVYNVSWMCIWRLQRYI